MPDNEQMATSKIFNTDLDANEEYVIPQSELRLADKLIWLTNAIPDIPKYGHFPATHAKADYKYYSY